MTSQVVRKHDPMLKVGNVVVVDGATQIIEYSDLPEEYARQTLPDGSLKLWAGSIAVHVFERSFLERASDRADALPFHHAHKKVAFVDSDGDLIKPTENNATKFERFIFDLLPSAQNAIVCEVDPADGFCAVKNAPPAPSETPQHVKDAIVALHTRWLQEAGLTVAEGVRVEINPMFALDIDQLKDKLPAETAVTEDRYFV
jgi:UDP-N-acetylglucosamine/UDP-N-acetylgalactosamine diphosphorylase